METDQKHNVAFGLRLISGGTKIDLYLPNQRELNDWLEVLQPRAINTGFEEDYYEERKVAN